MNSESLGFQTACKLLSTTCLTLLAVSPAFAQPQPAATDSTQQATDQDAAVPATANAEETAATAAPEDSGEIIVRAQRRNERLQDVPIAVTALPEEALERANVVTTLDIPKLTPSLQMNQSGNNALPRIRGIGTSGNSPTIENPVALYVDGVYYSAQTGMLSSLSNIEQIEVDKGPQGTLFGRNATGGLIQIHTKDPQLSLGGNASLSYENYETFVAQGYLTGPIADNFAADIALYYRKQGDGYGDNILTGQEINRADSFVVRSKWKYDNGTTSATLIGDYQWLNGAYALGPAPGQVPLGGLGPETEGQDVAIPAEMRSRVEQYGASLAVDHDFGSVKLLSITAYRVFDDINFYPTVASDPDSVTTIELFGNVKQASQEFQLQSDYESPFQWTTGIFLFRNRGVWSPARLGGVPFEMFGIKNLIFDAPQKLNSAAVYGQGTYAVTPDTNITAGLRYTVDKRKWNFKETLLFTDDSELVLTDEDRKSFKKLTWRLAADHRFTPDVMGYVSYNRGFKSGGFNDFNTPAVTFKPETLDAYEVGLKTDLFGKALRLNVAAFLYEYTNIQVPRFENGTQVLYNGAKAQVKGFEAEGTLHPLSNFEIGFGLSIMNSRYKDFPDADITSPAPGGGTIFTPGSAKGNELNATPDWTLNIAPAYTVSSSIGELTFAANYYYNDGWYAAPDNRLFQPSYSLIDANVALETLDKNWRISLFGRNLTDKKYSTFLYNQADGDGVAWAPPRTYGVKVERRF